MMAPSLDGASFSRGQDDKEPKSQESAVQFQPQGAHRAELGGVGIVERQESSRGVRLTVPSCSTRGKVLVPKVRSCRLAGLIEA